MGTAVDTKGRQIQTGSGPQSEALDIVIAGILLSLAKMAVLKQNVVLRVSCQDSFRYSNLPDMTDSIV